MDRLLSDSAIDIVTSEGLPLGCNVKSFSRVAMEKVLPPIARARTTRALRIILQKPGFTEHLYYWPREQQAHPADGCAPYFRL